MRVVVVHLGGYWWLLGERKETVVPFIAVILFGFRFYISYCQFISSSRISPISHKTQIIELVFQLNCTVSFELKSYYGD